MDLNQEISEFMNNNDFFILSSGKSYCIDHVHVQCSVLLKNYCFG